MVKRTIYLDKLNKLRDTEEVKIITGVRRSGKTHLLKEFIKQLKSEGVCDKNIIYISFESNKYNHIKDNITLNEIVNEKASNVDGRLYLFFDEIQRVENWEESINGYRIDFNSDIYVTGSYGNLLTGINSTVLSGRYIRIRMYPFSYKELLDYYKYDKNILINPVEEMKIFNEFISYGGFPGLLHYEEHDEKMDYLMDIYDSIMLKDIIDLQKIGSISLFRRLMRFMVTNIGNIFSANSISKYLKSEETRTRTSSNTILDYLNYATTANLLYQVKREDIKGKKILKTLEKYYVVDQGFYYLFNDENKRDMGFLLENIVFLELMKRGYSITIGKIQNLEVDFICKRPGKTFYVQVSESINDPTTREREFKSFEKIKDYYPKYIVTTDQINYSHNGIIHMNILEFLRNDAL